MWLIKLIKLKPWPAGILLFLFLFCCKFANKGELVKGRTPPDLQELIDAHDAKGMVELAHQKLKEHLGDSFPNLVLMDRKGKITNIKAFRGKNLCIFFAATDCGSSINWAEELEKKDWKLPEGYDEMIILIIDKHAHRLLALVSSRRNVFLVGWPMTDYLSYVRFYPIMFYISKDGIFMDYGGLYTQSPNPKDFE